MASAALGALLAWAYLGDITDVPTSVPRLALGVALAGTVLALVLPWRDGLSGTCRAGRFDCSMPAWHAADWRLPAQRPTMVAELAMLPMMCGLPWMVSLCRSESVPSQAAVGCISRQWSYRRCWWRTCLHCDFLRGCRVQGCSPWARCAGHAWVIAPHQTALHRDGAGRAR